MLGWLWRWRGETVEARAILDRIQTIAREAYVPPTSFAWIHFGARRNRHAFRWMDRAIDGRDQIMIPIET